MNTIRWIVSLADKPRSLNVALFCLGIFGILIAYNRGQAELSEVRADMRTMAREYKHEKDSILRVSQINEAKCTERLLDGQKSLIARIDLLNQELNNKLEKRDEADDRRYKQATVNKNKAIKNTRKLLETLK